MHRRRTARPGEVNFALLDRFSLGHASAGALLGALGIGFIPALTVAAGWEIIERPLKDRFPAAFPNPSQDTPQNAIGDTIAVLSGYLLARTTKRLTHR